MHEELVLVHVFFRHGKRTPRNWHYPNDPHIGTNYHPYGFGQLTNKGKQTMYGLGETLRKIYDNFLGNIYFPELVEATSTDSDRTKMSLQTVLASLFPPKGEMVWKTGFNWQPIPLHFTPLEKDTLLGGFVKFDIIESLTRDAHEKMFNSIDDTHKDLVPYLEGETGLKITSLNSLWNLHGEVGFQRSFGLKLPKFGESEHFKNLDQIVPKHYLVQGSNKNIQRFLIGDLVKKISNDTNKHKEGCNTKMYLYSVHDVNLAILMIFLEVYTNRLVPPGSCICLEIYRRPDYILKVLYREEEKEFKYLKFPNGEDFLSVKDFEERIEELYLAPTQQHVVDTSISRLTTNNL